MILPVVLIDEEDMALPDPSETEIEVAVEWEVVLEVADRVEIV